MQPQIAIFCKSFRDDFDRLFNLLDSHEKFCPNIKFILSIPKSDKPELGKIRSLAGTVDLIFDEDYCDPTKVGPYGWYQQQLCKLSIHKTGLADSYMSVDSDAYFVASINESDFYLDSRMKIVYSNIFTKYTQFNDKLIAYVNCIDDGSTDEPRFGSIENFENELNELKTWMAENPSEAPIRRGPWINRLFDVPGGTALQPGQILHASLLSRMESFFQNYGIDLARLIALIPWEYNWYGCWAAATCPSEIARSVSPILHFASDEDVTHAKEAGLTGQSILQRFKIIQMAARHFDTLVF